MANIKSAKKRILVTNTKTAQNRMVKSALKTTIKKFENAVNTKNAEEANALFVNVTKALEVVSYYKNAPYISMEVEDFLNKIETMIFVTRNNI